MTAVTLPVVPHLDDATLDDLLDDLLLPLARDAARLHLADCVPCRTRHDELVALLAAGRAARSAVTVPPDLWTVVAAATVYAPLVRRHAVRTMRPAMLLGGGLLMLGSVIGTGWLLEAASGGHDASATYAAAPATATSHDVAAARAESARLEQRLRERLSMMNPDDAVALRSAADRLALHRGALGALQTALREQPYDPYVAERLAALSAERRALFAEARRLADGAG